MNFQLIENLASELSAAKTGLDLAKEAVNLEKSKRTSFVSKLIDAFSVTGSEMKLRNAEDALLKIQAHVNSEASRWVSDSAIDLITKDNDAFLARNAQLDTLRNLSSRAERVSRWLAFAKKADFELNNARRACHSAKTTELLDIATTSAAVSALSYVDTSSAKNALRIAKQALVDFSSALPKRNIDGKIDESDDFFDLIIDVTIDPSVDFISWFNMGQLEKAEAACIKAIEQLSPTMKSIETISRELIKKIDAEREVLHQIEKPYLDEVLSKIPKFLITVIPNSIEPLETIRHYSLHPTLTLE